MELFFLLAKTDFWTKITSPPTVYLLILLLGSWFFTAFRVSRIMAKTGRSQITWFAICIVASAIPAVVFLWWQGYKNASGKDLPSRVVKQASKASADYKPGDKTCPHCGQRIPAAYANLEKCVHCKMILSPDKLA